MPSLKERLKLLSPRHLKELASMRVLDVVAREVPKARRRVDGLMQLYPSAPQRELAQRLIDDKKSFAGMVGGVSGVFGLISVPADLLVMVWLELVLLVDIATVYKVNLKSERARQELIEVLGYANGIGPMRRASPKVMGNLARALLERGGMRTLGRAIPLIAAPISAYLNNQHIQRVGDEAMRHYSGFDRAAAKSRASAGR